ncbi:MAG: DNA replication/repair protein RecF [Anaerolineales bacterium]|nr:DNA replication/repair protein RecF [Anaerolineales bacterium]
MYLTHLSLTNFRNFSRLDIDVLRGTMLLVGDNAQGKTSLLEAIYYLSTFTSFHASHQRELINFIAAREPLAVGRITADYQRGDRTHRLEVRIIQEKNGVNNSRVRREVLLDGVKRKISEAIGHFNAVLFLPSMLSIIDGPPAERRQYLNLAISQTDAHYTAALSAYDKALGQRNALLKLLGERGGDPDQLTYWDEQIILAGAYIIKARIQTIREIEDLAALAHNELTRGAERLRLVYRPAYDPYSAPANQIALPLDAPIDRTGFSKEEIADGFQEALLTTRKEEIARGMTTIGPHRDEMHFLSNGIDLGTYGSRGQIRTTLLAIKIAEVAWMREKTGFWPVLLLDEVLAELDPHRREDLLKRLNGIEQALLTTTDLDLFNPKFVESAATWYFRDGRLTTG